MHVQCRRPDAARWVNLLLFCFRPATFHISEYDLDSCIPPMLSALRFPFMVSIQNIPSSIYDLNSIAVGFSPESPVKFPVISGILF